MTETSIPSTGLPSTMTAVLRHEYGESEVLRVEEVPVPQPGPGEALVRVAATGVDRGAWHVMAGLPSVARLALGVGTPRDPRLGLAFSGRIVALGDPTPPTPGSGKTGLGGSGLAVGDAVFGAGSGAWAEYVVVKTAALVAVPSGTDLVEAATLPYSATTALVAVRDAARVSAGQRVLVLGASGGVGSFAVQLASRLGAEVVGSARAANAEHVRRMGAAAVWDHTAGELDPTDPALAPGGRLFDAIIDTAGARPLPLLRRLLTPRGRIAIVGAEGGGRRLGDLGRGFGGMLGSLVRRQKAVMVVSMDSPEALAEVAAMAAETPFAPVVAHEHPLAQARSALDRLTAGGVAGKVVLRP